MPTVKRCVNCRLKVTKIIEQRKAFYRQRIPESRYARKETVEGKHSIGREFQSLVMRGKKLLT